MKSVLVTGGTLRLGRIIADTLRGRGWRVLTTSHRPDAGADLIIDFCDPESVERGFAAARELLDGDWPTALVNNAALYIGDPAAVTAIGWSVPRRLTELMAAHPSGFGSVVNILDARLCDTVYGQAKAKLREWTQTAARRYLGILRVNSVSPGPLRGLSPTSVREIAGDCPHGQPEPAAVAEAVAFLLENEFVTGVDIPVDGGWRLGVGS